MMEMGRKSIASKILEALPEKDVLDQEYLVAYDFLGGPPMPRFYSSLKQITELIGNGSRLTQYSIYRTRSLKATLAIQELVRREGGEVQLYAVSETSPDVLLAKLEKAQEKDNDTT